MKDLVRINSEISPLISEDIIKIRPIEDVKADISKIDKELLKYFDVDDSILIERDQILSSLKGIIKNQRDLEKDVKAAIKTENKLEKTYYQKFSVLLDDLQKKVNQKFGQKDLLSDLIFPPASNTEPERRQQEAALRDTGIAQPAIGATSLAMLAVLGLAVGCSSSPDSGCDTCATPPAPEPACNTCATR